MFTIRCIYFIHMFFFPSNVTYLSRHEGKGVEPSKEPYKHRYEQHETRKGKYGCQEGHEFKVTPKWCSGRERQLQDRTYPT